MHHTPGRNYQHSSRRRYGSANCSYQAQSGNCVFVSRGEWSPKPWLAGQRIPASPNVEVHVHLSGPDCASATPTWCFGRASSPVELSQMLQSHHTSWPSAPADAGCMHHESGVTPFPFLLSSLGLRQLLTRAPDAASVVYHSACTGIQLP